MLQEEFDDRINMLAPRGLLVECWIYRRRIKDKAFCARFAEVVRKVRSNQR